ncbi:MAG: hypothetical protein EBV03_11495 [Proteobacteria bacterium]|nr:hypothetical protein [Pseudomonadota bacterium]
MDMTAIKAANPEYANQLWFRVLESMNGETQGFIIAIGVFTLFFHIRFTADTVAKAPAFLTTLGILGTFIGIAIGLLDFNANEVQRSVPALIEGVKTAVWVSACGVFCALTVKLRDILFRRRKTKRVSVATVDDLAESLKAIEAVLGGVEQAIVGDTEPSLLLQMKSAQAEHAETMRMFGESLAQFREHLAESNTKALVTSLNEVIRDFNVKLNEQFGDNFRQLNEATGKVLEWQQQYSDQMTSMVAMQGQTAQNMREASTHYQGLLVHAESFGQVVASLSVLLQGLEVQRAQLSGSLEQLASLVAGAATGLPQIEGHIVGLTRQVSDGMKTANEEFNAEVRGMIEATKAQVLQLDNALTEELTKALDTFGRQLASLSSKFAQDYGPITERLQAVLRIAS